MAFDLAVHNDEWAAEHGWKPAPESQETIADYPGGPEWVAALTEVAAEVAWTCDTRAMFDAVRNAVRDNPALRVPEGVHYILQARAAIEAVVEAIKRRVTAGVFGLLCGNELPKVGEREWLLDGILSTDGISLLAARAKVGKTVLAVNLARAVTLGKPFLGRNTKQGRVVYLALEGAASYWTALKARMNLPNEIIWHIGPPPKNVIEGLREAIRATHASLIIVDTLAKLVTIKNMNDYAEVAAAMKPYEALASETNCHILFLHHSPKSDGTGGNAFSGSEALFAAVEAGLIMKKDKGGVRTLETEQRWGEDMPLTNLRHNPMTDEITVVSSVAAQRAKESALDQRIFDTVARLGKPASRDEVYEATGGRKQEVFSGFDRLVNAGRLVLHSGTGKPGDPELFEVVK